jgi:hypothetical protein
LFNTPGSFSRANRGVILLLLGSLLTTGVTGYLLLGADGQEGATETAATTTTPAVPKPASGILASAYADDDDDAGEKAGGEGDENEGPL